jgi:hypothetical protein
MQFDGVALLLTLLTLVAAALDKASKVRKHITCRLWSTRELAADRRQVFSGLVRDHAKVAPVEAVVNNAF